MLHEVRHSKMFDTGNLVDEIDFEGVVQLYINHHPAFGVPSDQLKRAFDTFAEDVQEENSVLSRDTFIETLQEKGEKFTEDQTKRYLTILSPVAKWRAEGRIPAEDDIDLDNDEFPYIPEEFTYTDFMDDILGITLSPPTEGSCESPNDD